MKRYVLPTLALFSLICGISLAETPDECAARLDRQSVINTYEEASEWWAKVERECAPEPIEQATYDPSKPFTGIYGWEDSLDFCVMSPALNIRNAPNGSVIGRFVKGDIFSVDLASQELVKGFVWAKHSKGWSALFRYPGTGSRIDEFTYPQSCPSPTATPTVRRASNSQSAEHEIIVTDATKTFRLSGADCAITTIRGSSIESGKLYFAVGRLGWLRDEFMVDIFAPGGRSALAYLEAEVQGENAGMYSHQLYPPEKTKDQLGYYTIEVSTYTESQKYSFRANAKATYNIAVGCE